MTERTPPVLIVDDNHVNLKLMMVLLRSSGIAVRTAVDAASVLAAIEESVPRLILMDIQLPGMDGLTLTRRLRRDERLKGVIIIALTAYAMKGDEEKALEAGCDDFITKPIDVDTLPSRVRNWLERSTGGIGE